MLARPRRCLTPREAAGELMNAIKLLPLTRRPHPWDPPLIERGSLGLQAVDDNLTWRCKLVFDADYLNTSVRVSMLLIVT